MGESYAQLREHVTNANRELIAAQRIAYSNESPRLRLRDRLLLNAAQDRTIRALNRVILRERRHRD